MHRRSLSLLALCTALATTVLAWAAGSAIAAAPVIIPVSPESTDPYAVSSTTPGDNGAVPWLPGPTPAVKGYAINPGSSVYFIGDIDTKFPLVWEDVGSGAPRLGTLAQNGFSFPLAGEYPYHCQYIPSTPNAAGNNCFLDPRRAKIWVIGPRPILKATAAVPDNTTPPVLYNLDASGSFVTDFTAHNIVEYAFDFNSDGAWDQVSPDPYAQVALEPGDQVLTLRVRDDTGRVATSSSLVQVPKARPALATPPPADTSLAGTNVITGVPFPKANVRFSAKKRIKVTALRRNGVIVKVSGLTKGDTVSVRLLDGKKTLIAGRGKARSSTLSIRLKAGKRGRRLLKVKKKVTRMVLSVTASGEDGFTVTKRAALRVTR